MYPNAQGIIFLLPLLVGLYLFKIWPCIQVIAISFKSDYDYASGSYSALNLSNYQKIFNDTYFIQAFVNTLKYVVFVVAGTVFISLIISWCLFRINKGTVFFKTLFFLPLISSDIAVGISWRLLFNRYGIVNALLNSISIDSIGWLTDKDCSLLTLVVYGIWSSLPISVLLLYTSFQRVSTNLIIAAQIDHAPETKLFAKVVFPIVRPTVLLVSVINCISSWLVINGLFPLFTGLPGPYFNLYTMVYYIYSKSGEGNRSLGEACAASVVLLASVSILLIVRCLYGNKKHENAE